jgi:hypothetical protein
MTIARTAIPNSSENNPLNSPDRRGADSEKIDGRHMALFSQFAGACASGEAGERHYAAKLLCSKTEMEANGRQWARWKLLVGQHCRFRGGVLHYFDLNGFPYSL